MENPHFLTKLTHNFDHVKKFAYYSFKMPKEINRKIGENSPNLVTLSKTKNNFCDVGKKKLRKRNVFFSARIQESGAAAFEDVQ
jgi:hypothetical protein